MIPIDSEARAYFFITIVLTAFAVAVLVIVFRALNAADRADRRTRRAEAAVLGLSERLKARDRALEHWKQTHPSRLDDALAMRVDPGATELMPQVVELPDRPNLRDDTGAIT